MTTSSPPPPYTELPIPSHPTHRTRNGIPPQTRRSMEDEARSLPAGWIRQYDQELNHQFFVDTTTHPPRSIWHHPYDDDQYMSSLTSIERRQIEGIHRVPSDADMEAESTDEESTDSESPFSEGGARNVKTNPTGNTTTAPPTGIHKLGRKMKDKLTQTTHAERAARRQQREKEEAAAYRRHQVIRTAMWNAARTGEAQLVGRDARGRDVYIEPPGGVGAGNAGWNGRVYHGGGYGYNPFLARTQGPFGLSPYGMGMNGGGMYRRPMEPYRRPYAGGYGGGMGMPLAMGLGGGLMLGGLML